MSADHVLAHPGVPEASGMGIEVKARVITEAELVVGTPPDPREDIPLDKEKASGVPVLLDGEIEAGDLRALEPVVRYLTSDHGVVNLKKLGDRIPWHLGVGVEEEYVAGELAQSKLVDEVAPGADADQSIHGGDLFDPIIEAEGPAIPTMPAVFSGLASELGKPIEERFVRCKAPAIDLKSRKEDYGLSNIPAILNHLFGMPEPGQFTDPVALP